MRSWLNSQSRRRGLATFAILGVLLAVAGREFVALQNELRYTESVRERAAEADDFADDLELTIEASSKPTPTTASDASCRRSAQTSRPSGSSTSNAR